MKVLTNINEEVATIHKSIKENLENLTSNILQSTTKDLEDTTVLTPPVRFADAYYIFRNNAYLKNCCEILSKDVLFGEIKVVNQDEEEVKSIKKSLEDNREELYNLLVDFNYAGCGVLEYGWTNTDFYISQIPINTVQIVNTKYGYLLEQKVNGKSKFFKILGETYPADFIMFRNEKVGYCTIIGGDNTYTFFSLPKWIGVKDQLLTSIAINQNNRETHTNHNIANALLNIGLEPQLPGQEDDGVDDRIVELKDELTSQNGVAIFFTETSRPVDFNYIPLTNQNDEYLSTLLKESNEAVLNIYNIPLVRLMINTEKESMNSNKTQSIWEIYNLNLANEQKPFIVFLQELLYDLYGEMYEIEISLPNFSDKRETEVKILNDAYNNGGMTLREYLNGLSKHIEEIDITTIDDNDPTFDERKNTERLDLNAL